MRCAPQRPDRELDRSLHPDRARTNAYERAGVNCFELRHVPSCHFDELCAVRRGLLNFACLGAAGRYCHDHVLEGDPAFLSGCRGTVVGRPCRGRSASRGRGGCSAFGPGAVGLFAGLARGGRGEAVVLPAPNSVLSQRCSVRRPATYTQGCAGALDRWPPVVNEFDIVIILITRLKVFAQIARRQCRVSGGTLQR